MSDTHVQAIMAASDDLGGALETLGVVPGEPIVIMRAHDYVRRESIMCAMSARIDWATALCSRANPGRN
ncbi:MAG TPA: hypothetical protein VM283_00920 [Armatimonadota bacterium]|nr:hypothetical protein [Armatimonadota bacterium]